ncbi:hypothetical protein IEO21_11070 [Rhodonia placenta]|uniref:Uncharacterized protein n=1 Tax=Rhodonia placenta TaxID=104341 RepID=A0A8H7NR98_9APHY|nr:hypothetical protein IEO21_11070 [Postia placenta]
MSNASQENSQTASEETATVVPRRCLKVVEHHNRGTLSFGRAVLQLSQIFGDISGGMPLTKSKALLLATLRSSSVAAMQIERRPQDLKKVPRLTRLMTRSTLSGSLLHRISDVGPEMTPVMKTSTGNEDGRTLRNTLGLQKDSSTNILSCTQMPDGQLSSSTNTPKISAMQGNPSRLLFYHKTYKPTL